MTEEIPEQTGTAPVKTGRRRFIKILSSTAAFGALGAYLEGLTYSSHKMDEFDKEHPVPEPTDKQMATQARKDVDKVRATLKDPISIDTIFEARDESLARQKADYEKRVAEHKAERLDIGVKSTPEGAMRGALPGAALGALLAALTTGKPRSHAKKIEVEAKNDVSPGL